MISMTYVVIVHEFTRQYGFESDVAAILTVNVHNRQPTPSLRSIYFIKQTHNLMDNC